MDYEIASYELSLGYRIEVEWQDDNRDYVDIIGNDGITRPVLLSMSRDDFRGMIQHFQGVV